MALQVVGDETWFHLGANSPQPGMARRKWVTQHLSWKLVSKAIILPAQISQGHSEQEHILLT